MFGDPSAMDVDEPPRKRPHSFMAQEQNPFQAPSWGMISSTNTPFLFHATRVQENTRLHEQELQRQQQQQAAEYRRAEVVEVEMAEVEGEAEDFEDPASPIPTPAQVKKKPAAKAKRQPTVEEAEEEGEGEGEGEEPEERPIAQGAISRVRRRRKQWAQRNTEPSNQTFNLHMAPHTAPAPRHSEMPAIILGYVQVVFNVSLVIGFIYIAVQFILAVRRDIKERIDEYSVEIVHEIAGCTQAYLTNRCEPALRVPAMEAACSMWESCMSRDPKVVGRARVGAETFAGVINSFVDPISWKTMGFTLVTLGFLIVLTNSALFNLRAKHMHAPVQQQQQPFAPFMMPPQISHMGSMAQLGYGGMHAEQMGVAGHLAGAGHGQDAAANGVNGPQSNANGNGNGNSGIAAKTLGWLGGK